MPTVSDPLESAIVSRLMWRLMPFLFLLYIVAYIDRINVSFAVLQMRVPLELSDRVYGHASGIFFAGYFLFQLPSNLALEKVGVRRWISFLMVSWGVISCLMIFIRGPVSFYVMRFLLGAAEAGFFPGMILYMKRWFPAEARARAVAWFMTANPIAGIIGSPLSGALLGLNGRGLFGWQWMFLLEGIPAILLGASVFWTLSESPQDARWLTDNDRERLLRRLDQEKNLANTPPQASVWQVLLSWRIWLLSLVYFGVSTTMYGVTLWLPSVIRELSGLSYFWTGVVAALPFLLTAIGMVMVGMHSDRTGERRWHTAIAAFAGASALSLAAYAASPVLVVAAIGVGLASAEAMAGHCGRWRRPTWRFFRPPLDGFLAIATTLAFSGVSALIVGSQIGDERAKMKWQERVGKRGPG